MKSTRVGRQGATVIRTFYRRLLLDAFASMAVAFLMVACDTSSDGCECDGELDDDGVCLVADDALPDAQITEPGFWESAPWQGAPWLCFNSGMKLQIDHPLGYTPALVQIYLAFGNSDDGPNSVFAASGDLARIVEVTDTDVVIENNTEEYFFVRVVLE